MDRKQIAAHWRSNVANQMLTSQLVRLLHPQAKADLLLAWTNVPVTWRLCVRRHRQCADGVFERCLRTICVRIERVDGPNEARGGIHLQCPTVMTQPPAQRLGR